MLGREKEAEDIDSNKEFKLNPEEKDLEIVEEEEEKNPRDVIKKLRSSLKEAQKERQEFLELSQRLKADSINQRKEMDKWREEFSKFAEEKLIIRLLPVLESFSLATADRTVWESLPKDWRLGMEHIHKELVAALSEHGFKEINPEKGEKFDPRLHASIGVVKVSDQSLDHTITEVIQRGYSISERVLKPARVSIGEFSPQEK